MRKAEKAFLEALKTPAGRNTEIKRMPLRAAFVAVFFVLFGGLVGLTATTANADESITYELNLDLADAASADTTFNYQSTSIVKSAVNASGLPVFTPVNKPSAHWRTKYAKKCPTLSAYPSKAKIKALYTRPTIFKLKGTPLKGFRRAAMSDRVIKKLTGGYYKVSASCFWLRPGARFPDTVKDITGNVHGVGSSVKGNKPMLFEVAKATSRRAGESTAALVPIRRGQDFDGDGVIDDGDCGNKKPAVIEFPEGTYEYNDTDEYWWKDSGNVIARVHVGGSATIRQGNCAMTLFYDFFAQGAAGYSVVIKGKTTVEAHGRAVKVVSTQSAHADATANATAFVKANLKAQFDGCDTPAVQAPQVTPPTVNDVVVNNTRTVTFTGKLAKGLSGFASASAGTGVILGDNRVALVVDANGYFSVTFTYKAGSEPGIDTVTLIIDQSDGQSVTVKTKGRDASGQEVDYFQIRAVPPESE